MNAAEIRTLDLGEIASGSGLPWKLAMWGTPWDERLIRRLEKKWPSLESLEARWNRTEEKFDVSSPSELFCVSEGLQLKYEDGDDVEPVSQVAGKMLLDVSKLIGLRDIFNFPAECLHKLAKDARFYALKGRVKRPLTVCSAPHVVVNASRHFAVYSEDFIVIPARQIGIVSTSNDSGLLKALSLFLSSDFVYYHQFICSSQGGVKRTVATLDALRQIPVPLAKLSRGDLEEWAALHEKLSKCPPRTLHAGKKEGEQGNLNFADDEDQIVHLLAKLNILTAEVLGLDERERALVHDLVHVRLQLDDGKLGYEAIRPPSEPEVRIYARRLKQELDDFVRGVANRLHRVTVVRDEDSGSAMVEVDLTLDHEAARRVGLLSASSDEGDRFQEVRKWLLQERAQWVYFDRNLRIYHGHQTYIFKPLQRFQWTESAAMMDASDLIAETLGDGGAPR